MRAFACPRCGQLVYFENDQCLRCRSQLGFDPELSTIVLAGAGRRCANQRLAGCNWLQPRAAPPGQAGMCLSCRLTRIRPPDADLGDGSPVAAQFRRTEAAKRRLAFQLRELALPLVSHHDDPDSGLAFHLLVSKGAPITIGHDEGVITIDLAESDDAYRERMRAELREPYRTMLGHLRHEVGHYYWQVLVEPDPAVREEFRALFGDERADYQEALTRHYRAGPPPRWAAEHVSAYAAAHPWEDWAEAWAHYLHIRDSLQTAASYGMTILGPRSESGPFDPKLEPSLIAAPSIDREDSVDGIVSDWLALTYALNAINRSMGNDDLYPFLLSPTVIEKLGFVHHQVHQIRPR